MHGHRVRVARRAKSARWTGPPPAVYGTVEGPCSLHRTHRSPCGRRRGLTLPNTPRAGDEVVHNSLHVHRCSARSLRSVTMRDRVLTAPPGVRNDDAGRRHRGAETAWHHNGDAIGDADGRSDLPGAAGRGSLPAPCPEQRDGDGFAGTCGREARAVGATACGRLPGRRMAGGGQRRRGAAPDETGLGAAAHSLGGRSSRRGSRGSSGAGCARGRGRKGLLLGQGRGAGSAVDRAVGDGQASHPHDLRAGAAHGPRGRPGTRWGDRCLHDRRALPLRRRLPALGRTSRHALPRSALAASGRPPAGRSVQAAACLRHPPAPQRCLHGFRFEQRGELPAGNGGSRSPGNHSRGTNELDRSGRGSSRRWRGSVGARIGRGGAVRPPSSLANGRGKDVESEETTAGSALSGACSGVSCRRRSRPWRRPPR